MRVIRVLAGMALTVVAVAVVRGSLEFVYSCGYTKSCYPYDQIFFTVVLLMFYACVGLLLTDGGKSWPLRWWKPKVKQ